MAHKTRTATKSKPKGKPKQQSAADRPVMVGSPVTEVSQFQFDGRPATHGDWPGAANAFGQAIKAVAANVRPAWCIIGVSLALGILWTSLEPTPVNFVRVMGLAIAANLILALAFPRYCLAVADGKDMSMADFLRFDAGRLVAILIAIGVSTAIVFGSILLFVLPIIWTVPWLLLPVYIIADRKTDVLGALQESRRLTRNHKAKAWGIIAVTIALVLLVLAIGQTSPTAAVASNALGGGVGVLAGVVSAKLYRWLQAEEA